MGKKRSTGFKATAFPGQRASTSGNGGRRDAGALRVAAIVPALNEGQRIGAVLDALTRANLVDEIIVVSDGSTDDTAAVARGFTQVRVIELPCNIGKGGAMHEGVRHTGAEVLTFLDADLIGLRSEQICALIQPVASNVADMSIGVFRKGRYITDLSQRLCPYVSGQRAMRRGMFLTVPHVKTARMGVEIALTTHAKVNRYRVKRVYLDGVTHPTKEEKLGLVRGFGGRMNMYWEIVAYVTHERLVRRKDRVLRWLGSNGRPPNRKEDR